MLNTLRLADRQSKITLETNFKRDLVWFCKFVPKFNGTTFFFSHKQVFTHIQLNASLQGLSAMCDGEVYAITFPLGFQDNKIVHLEMINILVMLRICWEKWRGQSINIHCGNQAVVYILNSGCTQDLTLAAITRNVAMLTAERDIDLKIVHISGKDNTVADHLSQLFWAAQHFSALQLLIPTHVWVAVPAGVIKLDWSI